jgi:hypothetical protein
MAYMNQERKSKIAANIKPILKKYGMKGSLSVRNHSTIVLTLSEGPIDFAKDGNMVLQFGYHLDVNPYWYHEHYTGKSKRFLDEIIPALKSAGWYDNSDAQIDFFDCAYYFDVRIGKWNKEYRVTA